MTERRRTRRCLGLFLWLLLLPAWVSAQPAEGDYGSRRREAIREVSKLYAIALPLEDTVDLAKLKELAAAIDTGRDGRQFTASSLATPLATVIDQPTTTNFLSLALETGAFSKTEESNALTVSTTLYAVKRLFNASPWRSLEEYGADRNLRYFSGSMTFAKATTNSASSSSQVQAWTVRYQIGSRDLRDFYTDPTLESLSGVNAFILLKINELVRKKDPARSLDSYSVAEIKDVIVNSTFTLGPEEVKLFPPLSGRPVAVKDLLVVRGDLVERLMAANAPKSVGSVSFSELRSDATNMDIYRLAGSYQRKLSDALLLTANLSGENRQPRASSADSTYGGTAALELAGSLKNFKLVESGDPSRLSVAVSARVARRMKSEIMAQAKLEFLLPKGVSIPISVTWANRTDLVSERIVRGHVGISFDAASLLTIGGVAPR